MSPVCGALLEQLRRTETLHTPRFSRWPPGPAQSGRLACLTPSLPAEAPAWPPAAPWARARYAHRCAGVLHLPSGGSSRPSLTFLFPSLRSLLPGLSPWVFSQTPRWPQGTCLATPRSRLCAVLVNSRDCCTLVSYCHHPPPPHPRNISFMNCWAGSYGDFNFASSVKLPRMPEDSISHILIIVSSFRSLNFYLSDRRHLCLTFILSCISQIIITIVLSPSVYWLFNFFFSFWIACSFFWPVFLWTVHLFLIGLKELFMNSIKILSGLCILQISQFVVFFSIYLCCLFFMF